MNTFKNIGLIVGNQTGNTFQLSPISRMKGYTLKKVLITGDTPAATTGRQYPQAEIVQDKNSLMLDKNLDLIVITTPVNECIDLLGEVMRTGKAVRIM